MSRRILPSDLPRILDAHKRWIQDPSTGERAVLTGAVLTGANLSRCNIAKACLIGACVAGTRF